MAATKAGGMHPTGMHSRSSCSRVGDIVSIQQVECVSKSSMSCFLEQIFYGEHKFAQTRARITPGGQFPHFKKLHFLSREIFWDWFFINILANTVWPDPTREIKFGLKDTCIVKH